MGKYILVEWPEYQYYMSEPGIFYCADENVYFVPEEIYDKPFKSENYDSNQEV